MDANQTLTHRLEALSLRLGEVREAQLEAGVELRVLADEILGEPPGLVVQRIVRGAHIGVLRVAAPGRNSQRTQQRILCGYDLERAVGVPQPIADCEQAAPIVES